MNIRRRHFREPDFADLFHCVDDETTLANDPLISKEAFSGYVGTKETPNRRKLLKTYITAAEENTEEIVDVCQLCQKSHGLDARAGYKKKSVKERSKFFFRRNCAMVVTHQYHLNIMHKPASKCEFVTFAGKGILQGYMATKSARKIERVMRIILRRIMVPWLVQLPR